MGLYRTTNRPDETRPNVLGSVEYRLKKNVCMRWPWYFMTWPSSEVLARSYFIDGSKPSRSEFACEASLLVINGMPLRTKLRDFGRQCPEKAPYDEFKNDIFEKRRILKGSRQNLTSMYVI